MRVIRANIIMPPVPVKRFFRQHIARTSTHVALLNVFSESVAEVDGLGRVVGGKHVAKILDHHVGVVVSLHEPVCFVAVVSMDLSERTIDV